MRLVWIFVRWLPFAVVITGLCGLVQVTVQQNYRQSLNDPQIQMAEDAVGSLDNGAVPASVVPRGQLIDIGASLSPWIALYDKTGTPLESSGQLNNAPPKPPIGVFDDLAAGIRKGVLSSTQTRENRISWQPTPEVRQAIVIVQAKNGGFVVAGRNMREVESREAALGEMVLIGWLVLLVSTLAVIVMSSWFKDLQA